MKTKLFTAGALLLTSLCVSGQDAKVKSSTGEDTGCHSATPSKVVWRPAVWPSREFIANNSVNYLGRCDSISVDSAHGLVTALLSDITRSEEIRCKYEVAGLGELTFDSEHRRKTAKKVLDSCWAVFTTNLDMAKDLR